MRLTGRITDWRDDRGFGFITPNSGGAKVFVHVSDFQSGQRRPIGNELVTYELITPAKKGPRARNVLYVGARPDPRRTSRRGVLRPVVYMLIVAGFVIYGWTQFASSPVESSLPIASDSRFGNPMSFQCEGKQRCSEMTSCEEAMFYLKNCHGVRIDGDHDGVPCEDQWCGR